MGLFDFLKRQTHSNMVQSTPSPTDCSFSYALLPNKDEAAYYRPSEYYTKKAFEGTQFERPVITFDERKRTCIPSRNGLYVAEILLVAMCNSYPNPKNGYPGYWWFEYGIRNVGNALKSLERRGFIHLAPAMDSLDSMTVSQLKQLLTSSNLSTTGKKADLIDCIQRNFSEIDLIDIVTDRKYSPTELGRQELQENEYVLFMHRHPHKTTENSMFDPAFNVWAVNKRLNGNTSNWYAVVSEMEHELNNSRTRK